MQTSSDSMPVVETINLVKIFGGDGGVRALDGIDLRIARGEFVAIMGPSGSGKSTLLNMLGALDRPTQGVVRVNGQDLAAVRNLDQFRARAIGFVFQLHNLIPTLTALENVEVPMQGIGIPAHRRQQRAMEILQSVDLRTGRIFYPASFPAARGSGWLLPAPWPMTRLLSWPMSPPGIWIAAPGLRLCISSLN